MTTHAPLPAVNSDTEEWWEATRDGRLLVQHCRRCEDFQHYPRPFCLSCRSTDLDFKESTGRGVIYSFSVVHRSPDPGLFEPPYVVALVQLEEGPTLFTSIVDYESDDLYCGQAVAIAWRPLSDGRQLPVFSPMKGVSDGF